MKLRNRLLLTMLLLAASVHLWAGNPIRDETGGMAPVDPHVVIYGQKAYMYASHDFSPQNTSYVMKDWWVWSSDDLVNWKVESILKPEDTFIGKPFNDCWATFGISKNGKYFWYFSAGPEEIGVVESDSPVGPWKDPLGKPFLPQGFSATSQRDPDLMTDDDGKTYMIYGTMNYFIVRLNDDMISLAEAPRPVEFDRRFGPYGEGQTDDKPSLHKRNGTYYLSWSSFYATSPNIYGPYTYKGSVIDPEMVAPEFRNNELFFDRHGNFFQFHNQWYYTCNDLSQPGRTRYYRDAIIAYVHYKDNGDMAPVRIDKIGVGQYDSQQPRIEAEDFFKSIQAETRECPSGGFEMRGLGNKSALFYPNVMNLAQNSPMTFLAANGNPSAGVIEVRENNPEGALLGTGSIAPTGGWDKYQKIEVPLNNSEGTHNLCLVFKGNAGEICRLDWFAFPGSRP